MRKELEQQKLIQLMDPLPGREEELRHICRMFGFTEDMCDMPKDKVLEMYEEDSPYYGELPLGLEERGV